MVVIGRNEPDVGGHVIALLELDDVANDQVAGEYLLVVAVAHDPSIGRKHLGQGVGFLTGLVFLPKGKEPVDDVDEPDGNPQFL